MGLTISSDATFINIGNKSIQKSNVLFLDYDPDKVYIIMSGRKPGFAVDGNNIAVAYADVSAPQTFASALALKDYLKTLF